MPQNRCRSNRKLKYNIAKTVDIEVQFRYHPTAAKNNILTMKMKAYQIKFVAWTFSAFLPPDDPSSAEKEVDCYELLDVPRNANADDLKKAYRKRSLLLHPDKLRQRGMRYEGKVITEEEARLQFQHMKAAYDILSDPRKRQIYDATGHKGMDFVLNPSHAWDPHVLLGNLAKSSVLDRAKLMTLVILFFGLILLQPILLCAKVDQMLEKNGGALQDASWVALLIPFWLFAACFAVVLIIGRAVLPLLQFISFVVAILFLALKFDNVISWNYAELFIPFYVWMLLRFIEAKREMAAAHADMTKMVTIEYVEKYIINEKKQDENGNDIEGQLHRTYNDLNEEERDRINKEYIIVHVPPRSQTPTTGENEHEDEDDFERIERSPEYMEARARYMHTSKSIHRIILPELPLIILVIVQLDMDKSWNWGLTFLPLWIAMFVDCAGGCFGFCCTSALAHMEVQEAMANHFAKEQEAKSGSGEPSNNNEEVKTDALKVDAVGKKDVSDVNGDGVDLDPKTDLATDAITSDATRPSALFQPVNSVQPDDAVIDTAILLEPATKSEPNNAEGKDIKPKLEGKESKESSGDDEFVFEMDEDTFRYFQQAEVEAENKATEAQSKAIGSFCNIIFQAIIASLFVVKLNQLYGERDEESMDGTTSFSTFWILFPFFVISGCIVSCFACAIFGASNFESAMSSEDAGVHNDGRGGDDEETGTTEASPVVPTPPPSQGTSIVIPKQDADGQTPAPLEAESLPSTTTEVKRADPPEKMTITVDPTTAMDDLD